MLTLLWLGACASGGGVEAQPAPDVGESAPMEKKRDISPVGSSWPRIEEVRLYENDATWADMQSALRTGGRGRGACARRQGGGTTFEHCPADLLQRIRAKRLPRRATVGPCPEEPSAICVRGGISKGRVAKALEAEVDKLRKTQAFVRVYLDSTGGSPGEAMIAGRMLHAKKAITHLRSDAVCLSACNFLFLGGVRREVESGAIFASHSFDLACMRRENQKEIASLAVEESNFSMDMGASKCFLPDVMLRYSASAMRCISPEELKKYNIVNMLAEGEEVSGFLPRCERKTSDLMRDIYQAAKQNARR